MVLRQRPVLQQADLAAGLVEGVAHLGGHVEPGLRTLVDLGVAGLLAEDRAGQHLDALGALKQAPEARVDSLKGIHQLAHGIVADGRSSALDRHGVALAVGHKHQGPLERVQVFHAGSACLAQKALDAVMRLDGHDDAALLEVGLLDQLVGCQACAQLETLIGRQRTKRRRILGRLEAHVLEDAVLEALGFLLGDVAANGLGDGGNAFVFHVSLSGRRPQPRRSLAIPALP